MKLRFWVTALVAVFSFSVFAESDGEKKTAGAGYVFEDEISLPVTPVKDQYRTGTCWSFSTMSFLESELLRLGKPEVDLSEMFAVWHSYVKKAQKDVRLHGSLNFSSGGSFHDVTNTIREYGIVPESVYNGLRNGSKKHIHSEMDRVLKENVDAVINNQNEQLSTVWQQVIEGTLNTYLGNLPVQFEYEGKEYTPQTFAKDYIGLNMDDYVEITSYTHHPFYSRFILEIPDNWSWDQVYNVPIEDLENIIENALTKGFTVAWAADVTEKGFLTSNKGVAILPAAPHENMTDAEISQWQALPDNEKQKELYQLENPVPEITVTQTMRQEAFDTYQTTDDHGMHIVGMAKDQEGKTFYKVKNSWGNYNRYDGYFYASKPYVAYKTMSIMVHKDAIPDRIRNKLEL